MPSKREFVVRIGGEAFIDCLQKYGSDWTIHLLVEVSKSGDWIADELLCLVPSTVALASFLKRVPMFTVTEEEFEHWCKSPSFLFGAREVNTNPSTNPSTEEIKDILIRVGKLMNEKAKK